MRRGLERRWPEVSRQLARWRGTAPVAPKHPPAPGCEGGPVAPKHPPALGCDGGFSLIETMVAAGLLTASLVYLAQLLDLAARNNVDARAVTLATVLAQQKVEELRALAWGFDLQGLPIGDASTDTAANPPGPTGGTGLSVSPSSSLDENTSGFVDYVDRFGDKLGGGAAVPAGAVYTRRWSIQPLPADPGNGLIIQVLVLKAVVPGGPITSGKQLAQAGVVTVRTRTAP